MDFLDPKKKKAHRQRLLIGYVLVAIAVALGTLILLFSAYGYDIDRETGEIIQNGIVFVDSKPNNASIYVNDTLQKDRTGARLALPAGTYTVRVDLKDYRSWSRTFQLEGAQIARLVYPLLIPKELKGADLQLYASQPAEATTSPDRHWLLVQRPGTPGTFDQFDISQDNPSVTTLQVPANIMSEPTKPYTLSVLEWSNDNRHVILDRVYDGKHEFILFDREEPASSVNVATLFGVPVSSVQLRNKKSDELYLYDASGGIVRSANVKAKTVSGPILSNVLSFKTYNDNLIFYVTSQGAPAGKATVRILRDDKAYTLRQIPSSSSYVLDFTEYDNHWYYAAGASSEDTVYVYRDPLNALDTQKPTAPSVATIIRLTNPQYMSFSANSRFVAVQGGNKVVTYDAEEDRQFKLTLEQNLDPATKVKWMDGHRLVYVDAGEGRMLDFDGSNKQALGKVTGALSGPLFDRDYDNMFTLGPSVTVPSRTALVRTSLIVK